MIKLMKQAIKVWLLITLGLVATIVIIGGITRLTGSGLSMVDWRPIMGSIPPLTQHDWTATFDMYKQSPEFKQINSSMTLSEFKFIFFWEYLHRMIGRLIGLAAFLPFIYFLIKKQLTKPFIKRWTFIIFLIGCQGLMGWYMVKSGLVNTPQVSHFRLAAHLSLAFIIFCLILNELLKVHFNRVAANVKQNITLIRSLFLIIGIQIIYGAFTAGLHGGKYYNTYPKMGPDWFPEAALMYGGGIINNALNNPILIQWIHRWLAIAVVIGAILIWQRCQKSDDLHMQYSGLLLIATVSFQFILGVITLLSVVWLPVAVAHQFGALILIASMTLIHYFATHYSKTNV